MPERSPYRTAVPLEPGLTARLELVVTEDDLATAFGSGDVPVLATPRVIALLEEATACAVRDELQPDQTTVGMRVQVEHLTPTGLGSTVTAEATIVEIQGRRIMFKASAHDERGLIAAGRVTRVLVNRERFLERAR